MQEGSTYKEICSLANNTAADALMALKQQAVTGENIPRILCF